MDSVVTDKIELSHYELNVHGATAITNYKIEGIVIVLMHTETPAPIRGQGIASRLVEGILKNIRGRGLKVVPHCSFVRDYFSHHPEESDLLAHRR
jgi:predicted GNAT family acetyltransferase